MKNILCIFLTFLSLAVFAKNTFSVGDGKTPDFDKYKRLKIGLINHGREVKSDYNLVPGSVVHWFADGSVTTNKLVHIDCLIQTNTVEKQIEDLNARIAADFIVCTNQLAQITALSNLYTIVSAQAQAATAKINDEIADLEAKIEKYEGYKTKYPLLKTIWEAFITDAENRIKILQALTGGS